MSTPDRNHRHMDRPRHRRESSTSPTCWMRQDRRCSLAPSRTTRPTSRRSALARSPSASPARGRRPARLAGKTGVLAVAARRGVVAYVPGLVMRRAADLYPGESKTDRRDAFVLADTGRTRRHQVHGSMPATTNSWCSCAFSTATTPTSPPMRRHRLSEPPAGCAHQCFPRPWSAYWAPNSTLRGHGTCSPRSTRHRRRWPRRSRSRGRIARTLRKRSPRLAAALTEAVTGALDAQTGGGHTRLGRDGRVIAEVARTELDRTQQSGGSGSAWRSGSSSRPTLSASVLGSLRYGGRAGAGRVRGCSPRSVTSLASRTDRGWPATAETLPRSPASPAGSIRGQTRSRRGNHRLKNAMYLSAGFADRCATPSRARSTTASGPREGGLRPPPGS